MALRRDNAGRFATTPDLVAAFWSKVRKGNGCWLWLGARQPNGYGRFFGFGAGKYRLAHRFSYELARGRIHRGKQIDHLCRNRLCVNPIHLEAVSCRTNLVRGKTLAASNLKKNHCPQGHLYEGNNLRLYGRKRICRTCDREKARRYRAKKGKEKVR